MTFKVKVAQCCSLAAMSCDGGRAMTEQQIIETLATKVMGWKKDKYMEDGSYIADAWYDDQGDFVEWVRDWRPLKNIVDAWQLVEKMRERQYYLGISPTPDGYEVHPERMDRSKICTETFAKTAQEAISKAAYELVA